MGSRNKKCYGNKKDFIHEYYFERIQYLHNHSQWLLVVLKIKQTVSFFGILFQTLTLLVIKNNILGILIYFYTEMKSRNEMWYECK